jgi:hypothetical protein
MIVDMERQNRPKMFEIFEIRTDIFSISFDQCLSDKSRQYYE